MMAAALVQVPKLFNHYGFVSTSVAKLGVCPLLLLLALWPWQLAQAHALDQSYIFLTIHEQSVSGRIEITIADLNQALVTEMKTDGSLVENDLLAQVGAAQAYFRQHILLTQDGRPTILLFTGFELKRTSKAQYLALLFTLEGQEAVPAAIDFEYTVLFDKDPDHRGFVVVENDWKTGTFNNEAIISLIFEPGRTSGTLDLSASTVAHGFWQMTRLGVHHIWIGIDHILFLLALLLPSVVQRHSRGWKASGSFKASLIYVLKIVTLFTVAHTITLSAATLSAISVPERLVESVIALSIAVAAADVLWPIFRHHIWWVVFAFGLFHGMGFATVLSSIGVPPGYMTYSLLAFNIGVELGQLAIVCVAFPLLYAIRQGKFYQRLFLPAGATAMILVSMYWFIERGFLIDLPAGEYTNWLLNGVGARG